MAATPTPAAETVPGYVRDSATGQWFRIGAGAHTHTEYVPKVGGVAVGPGTLSVVTPVDADDVARYADGCPRFADVAARDTFYTALPGGAQSGMQCWVGSLYATQTYSGGAWHSQPVRDYGLVYYANGASVPSGTMLTIEASSTHAESYMSFEIGGGKHTFLHNGRYSYWLSLAFDAVTNYAFVSVLGYAVDGTPVPGPIVSPAIYQNDRIIFSWIQLALAGEGVSFTLNGGGPMTLGQPVTAQFDYLGSA